MYVYRAISSRFPTIVLTSSLLNTFSYKTQRNRRLLIDTETEGRRRIKENTENTRKTRKSKENKRNHNEMTNSKDFRLFTIALFCSTLFLACEVSSESSCLWLSLPSSHPATPYISRRCIYLHLGNV